MGETNSESMSKGPDIKSAKQTKPIPHAPPLDEKKIANAIGEVAKTEGGDRPLIGAASKLAVKFAQSMHKYSVSHDNKLSNTIKSYFGEIHEHFVRQGQYHSEESGHQGMSAEDGFIKMMQDKYGVDDKTSSAMFNFIQTASGKDPSKYEHDQQTSPVSQTTLSENRRQELEEPCQQITNFTVENRVDHMLNKERQGKFSDNINHKEDLKFGSNCMHDHVIKCWRKLHKLEGEANDQYATEVQKTLEATGMDKQSAEQLVNTMKKTNPPAYENIEDYRKLVDKSMKQALDNEKCRDYVQGYNRRRAESIAKAATTPPPQSVNSKGQGNAPTLTQIPKKQTAHTR
jgi:hypothetical protein